MAILFWLRCGAILAATAVLVLAMIQPGSEGNSAGACAGIQERHAQVSLLQPAGRAFAMTARICSF
ncbi:MAG TPA: hypothetical protein VG742_19185 [Dongiaceae bacterium]|nr:hypothetical protein [Dongiaceae bacterium]